MAANILRVLSEIENKSLPVDQVKFALGYAPACDQLEFDHWQRLYTACDTNPKQVYDIVREILPHYVAQYFALDCPSNNEAWCKVKYHMD